MEAGARFPFRCEHPFCSRMYYSLDLLVDHIAQEHPHYRFDVRPRFPRKFGY